MGKHSNLLSEEHSHSHQHRSDPIESPCLATCQCFALFPTSTTCWKLCISTWLLLHTDAIFQPCYPSKMWGLEQIAFPGDTPLSILILIPLCWTLYAQLLHPHCPRPMSKLCMIPMVMFQPKLKCSRDSTPAVSLSAQETWRAWCKMGRNVLVQSQKKSGKWNYGAVFTQVSKGLRVIEWWWTESKKAKDRERGDSYPISKSIQSSTAGPFQNSTSFARVHRNRSRSLQRTSDQQICTSKRLVATKPGWITLRRKGYSNTKSGSIFALW